MFDISKLEFNQPSEELFIFLYNYCVTHKPKKILEIGTGWGVSATGMLTGSPGAQLTTIDKRDDLPEFDKRVATAGVKDRIVRIKKDSSILKQLSEGWDLIFIDGSHVYEDVKADLINSLRIAEKSIICDDFFHKHNYTGKYGVTKAVVEVAREYYFKIEVSTKANGLAIITI